MSQVLFQRMNVGMEAVEESSNMLTDWLKSYM